MRYALDLRPSARKDLTRLPQNMRVRVAEALDRLCDDPRGPNTRALHGQFTGRRRLRVGNYRVLYIVEDETRTVDIIRVGTRESFYE